MKRNAPKASLTTVLGNQKRILANQGVIQTNQKKLDRILANQATILRNQKQIMASTRAAKRR